MNCEWNCHVVCESTSISLCIFNTFFLFSPSQSMSCKENKDSLRLFNWVNCSLWHFCRLVNQKHPHSNWEVCVRSSPSSFSNCPKIWQSTVHFLLPPKISWWRQPTRISSNCKIVSRDHNSSLCFSACVSCLFTSVVRLSKFELHKLSVSPDVICLPVCSSELLVFSWGSRNFPSVSVSRPSNRSTFLYSCLFLYLLSCLRVVLILVRLLLWIGVGDVTLNVFSKQLVLPKS